MLKILTILLLCGLLPFQEAVAQEGSPMTAMVNLGDLASLLSGILEKLFNTLLGGGLLGGSRGSSTGGTPDKQSGLLGGLLGRRRRDLLGGALGGNKGLVEGLLGGQGGLLGGLMGGKDGLLGGLLGDRGLLGGLLGENGPLGSLLKLLGLKIGKIDVLDIKLKTLSNGGLGLNITIKLELGSNSRYSKPILNLLVDVHLSLRIMQVENGVSKLVMENCLTDPVHIELLPGTAVGNLVGTLSKTLNKLLPEVLCPVLQLVPELLNALLGILNPVLSVGQLGSVHYAPAGPPSFQDGHMLLNLMASLGDNKGNTISQVPAGLSAPVPVTDDASKLLFNRNILRSLLELLVKRGQLNADITPQMLSGDVPMTTSELESILPGISELVPDNVPLVVRITISDTPVISIQNGNIRVTLKAAIEVLAQKDSKLTPLLVLEADIKLAVQLKILERNLQISVDIESLELRLVSSEIGDIDVGRLKDWLMKILQMKYIPMMNEVLSASALPLPKILDLGYPDGPVSILGNNIVAPLAPPLP